MLARTAWRWRGGLRLRCRAARAEKSLEEALSALRLGWRDDRLRALHAPAARYLAAIVRFWFHVRSGPSASHLRARVFTGIGRIRRARFVLPFSTGETVFEFDRLVELKWVWVVGGLDPRELRIETSLLHRN